MMRIFLNTSEIIFVVKSKFPHLINTDGKFEKSEIAWLSLEELKRKRLSFRPFYREVVDAIIENKEILQN